MIKSIIIAIVVAVIIWAVSFDFFFAYNGTLLSFGIAVAAGIIVGLILRALTPKTGILILVVAIVTLGATFLASKLVKEEECGAPPAKLSCGSANVVPDCFVAEKGTTFTWDTSGLPNGATVTIHKFKKKILGFPFPAQPVNAGQYTGNNQKPISATVKNKGGYFKYTLTCSPTDVKDPMIKVPN